MFELEKAKEEWKSFLEWVDSHAPNSYYRGHSSEKYLLLPKVGRESYSLRDELNMFEHFKRRAGLYSNFNSDFEWLALAQHHGLPTRLLDWTLNPLIAAFFAVHTKKEEIGRVYSISTIEHDFDFIDLNTLKSPFHIGKVSFLHPPISTRRIELQKGIFSVHPLPNNPVLIVHDKNSDTVQDLPSYFKRNSHLQKPNFDSVDDVKAFINDFYNPIKPFFEISPSSKDYFENRIRHLGIDETIFGDVDSIAQHIHFLQKTNFLKQIVDIDYEAVKPFWEKQAGAELVNYFNQNQDFLVSNTGLHLFNSDFGFYIEKLEYNHYNRKIVTGHISYIAYPNYDNETTFSLIENENGYYKNIFSFLKDLKVKHNLFLSLQSSIGVKIEVSTFGFDPDTFKIRKVEVNQPKDYYRHDFSTGINQFSKLKDILGKEDLRKLVNCKGESEVYSRLLQKYNNKISFE